MTREGERLVVRDDRGERVLELDATCVRLTRVPRHLRVESGPIEVRGHTVHLQARSVSVQSRGVRIADRAALTWRGLTMREEGAFRVSASHIELMVRAAATKIARSSLRAHRTRVFARRVERELGELQVRARNLRERVSGAARETLGSWQADVEESDVDAGRLRWRSEGATSLDGERIVLGSEEG